MDFWPYLLLGVGLVLLVLEVFIPSAGILGSLAAAAIVAGGVIAYRAEGMIFTVYVLMSAILVPAAGVIALKIFPKTPIGKHMTLAGPTFDVKEASAGGAEYDALKGAVGVATTPLRPAGKGEFAGRWVDITTSGEMIESGRSIRVIRVEGNRVFVAEVKS